MDKNSTEFANKTYDKFKQPYALLETLKSLDKVQCDYTIAEIHGHTDSFGSAEDNMELSHQRAVKVQHWLNQNGYWVDTAEIIPHGENDLFIDTEKPGLRKLNDRVTVKITGVTIPYTGPRVKVLPPSTDD